jgi:hypothetical protein
MRFLISLQREGSSSILPINYQYELSSLIYKIIDRADSAFSEFLHRQGYMAYGKNFRLFTFSRIQFDRYQVIAYFLIFKAIFSRSWILIFSTHSFIRLSISRDLSIEMSPFGRLLSSKLYEICLIDILKVRDISKGIANQSPESFDFFWSSSNLLKNSSLVSDLACFSLLANSASGSLTKGFGGVLVFINESYE